ncbi:YdeI/OmpD-associated family protein [Chloroflexota bacterium]
MNRLRRPLQPMPDFIRQALVEKGLMDAYINRPPYQRNDYLSWIIRAKQEKTRQKRLNQMLDELAAGDSYMNMRYKAKPV